MFLLPWAVFGVFGPSVTSSSFKMGGEAMSSLGNPLIPLDTGGAGDGIERMAEDLDVMMAYD